jgi:outer membrane protein assembly factor BamA
MNRYVWFIVVVLLAASDAWSPLSRDNSGGLGGGNNNYNPLFVAVQEDNYPSPLFLSNVVHKQSELRGGAAQKNPVIKGSKNTLQTTAAYWSNSFKSTTEGVSNTIGGVTKKVTGVFQSKEKKQELALLEKLKTTPVRSVSAPNSTVLPPEILSVAAKRSGMIGSPLRVETVQEMARNLKQWYTRKGYVLHSVTGATLLPDTGMAELQVQEPKVSKEPVGITFCKEMVVDDDGSLVTYRQYREKHAMRKTFGHDTLDKNNLNMTYVETSGRTDPSRIAQALKMTPGRPFRWDGSRWHSIAGSGVFSRILKASPERARDGTVQLRILATEAPPRNLEYGISKSLYTGSWEGEVDFQHNNLLGGGETLGVSIRRGTKDAEPSVRLKYSDDRFGMEGGYDLELFSDYVGDSSDGEEEPVDEDALLDRRGATVRIRNPIDPSVIRHSSASASLERTSSLAGYQEGIGSASLTLGPFLKELPMDARSNLLGRVMAGTRVADVMEDDESDNVVYGYKVLPYTMASATTRQIFPFASVNDRRPISLALQHVITSSSPNLPRHEASALGVAARVRGYASKDNGHITSSVVGTTEVRIPVTLPTDKVKQDASVVLFGDWVFAQKSHRSRFFRKSSVGIGLRKTIQGIPLMYDLSYTKDGDLRGFFGLGRDFDV